MNSTIRTRLEELRGLRDGWFHGGGAAPGGDFIDWMRDTFAAHYPRDLPLCEIIPIVEGGLRVNWFGPAGALAADVYLTPSKHARMYGISVFAPDRVQVMGVVDLSGAWWQVFTLVSHFYQRGGM